MAHSRHNIGFSPAEYSKFLSACRAGDVGGVAAGLRALGPFVHVENDFATRTAIVNRCFHVANLIMDWCIRRGHPVVIGTLTTSELSFRMVMAPLSTLRLCVAGHLRSKPRRVWALNFSQLLQCAVLNAPPRTIRWLWAMHRFVVARRPHADNHSLEAGLQAAIHKAQTRSVWLWNAAPVSRLRLFDHLAGTTLGLQRQRRRMARRVVAAALVCVAARRIASTLSVLAAGPGSHVAARSRAAFFGGVR